MNREVLDRWQFSESIYFYHLLISTITTTFVTIVSCSVQIYVKCYTFIRVRTERHRDDQHQQQLNIVDRHQQPYFAMSIIRLVYHYSLILAIIVPSFIGLDIMVTLSIIITILILGHSFHLLVYLLFFERFRACIFKTMCSVRAIIFFSFFFRIFRIYIDIF